MASMLTIETHPLAAVEHNGMRLTAFARAWQLRLPAEVPFIRGGLVWNRPVSVLVTEPDGHETVLPITDPTRIIVWTLAGLSAALALAFIVFGLKPGRRKS